MSIVMVTGGARSGKSSFAQNMCMEMDGRIGFIATAVVTDDDMRARIERHQDERPAHWETFETQHTFAALAGDKRFEACDAYLLDCLTTLTANHMMRSGLDFEACDVKQAESVEDALRADINWLMAYVRSADKRLVAVTNEVGMGVVPITRVGSLFRDIAGRVNMHFAQKADEVYCLISGLSQRLK